MRLLVIVPMILFLSGYSPPDKVEYDHLKNLYAICFDIVKEDLSIDLNNLPSSLNEGTEHYRLARSRIISAVNDIENHMTTGRKTGSYITQTNTEFVINLKYLIALGDRQSSSRLSPVYHLECKINKSHFQE